MASVCMVGGLLSTATNLNPRCAAACRASSSPLSLSASWATSLRGCGWTPAGAPSVPTRPWSLSALAPPLATATVGRCCVQLLCRFSCRQACEAHGCAAASARGLTRPSGGSGCADNNECHFPPLSLPRPPGSFSSDVAAWLLSPVFLGIVGAGLVSVHARGTAGQDRAVVAGRRSRRVCPALPASQPTSHACRCASACP